MSDYESLPIVPRGHVHLSRWPAADAQGPYIADVVTTADGDTFVLPRPPGTPNLELPPPSLRAYLHGLMERTSPITARFVALGVALGLVGLAVLAWKVHR